MEILRTRTWRREGGRRRGKEVFNRVVHREAGDIMALFLKTSHMAFLSGAHAYSARISLHSPDHGNNPETDSPAASGDLGPGSEAWSSCGIKVRTPSVRP